MDRIFAAIGGGELRNKSTLTIDRQLAAIAKERAREGRANALFFPTASHDSLPYFNTFRKTFTSELNMKSDVVLLTKKDVPLSKNAAKIAAADLIYLGGGDTLHLMEVLKQTGTDQMIWEAYQRGAVLTGLSAGGICWFRSMYSDSEFARGTGKAYGIYPGMGLIDGLISPHYNQRHGDFDTALLQTGGTAYAVEDNAALLFVNEQPTRALCAGGNCYYLEAGQQGIIKRVI